MEETLWDRAEEMAPLENDDVADMHRRLSEWVRSHATFIRGMGPVSTSRVTVSVFRAFDGTEIDCEFVNSRGDGYRLVVAGNGGDNLSARRASALDVAAAYAAVAALLQELQMQPKLF